VRYWLTATLVVAGSVLGGRAAEAAVPHRSMTTLSSSNGWGSIAYDATQYKLTQFLEHAYQAADASTLSRNFVYDSYPGIRVGTSATWLNAVPPTVIEYVPGTGIIHTQQSLAGVTVDTYHFQPMSLAANASVMLVKVTNVSATSAIDVYSLFNYQVGTGSPAPGNLSESTVYDASNDAYYETGPAGIAFGFTSIGQSTHHGSTPNNPYTVLNAGGNLDDDPGSGGPTTGAVVGFQTSLGTLAAGGSGWAGWVTVLAPDANGAAAVSAARTWLASETPAQALAAEQAGWTSWIKPAPSGADAFETAVDQQSQVILRMAQVAEPGAAKGQILAAIAPGEWNITWVRDMAYSVVALVKSGHYAEAKAALAFQMGASSGTYQSYLANAGSASGYPYQISVCRYYGNGSEWSDQNADGPNIEFDGFGLFLWSLDEYVKASGDTASLATWWPTIKSKVADVLVDLQEPTGLIAADSSIWEVHWEGQQRHFAYTTASAANGLCSASALATGAGDSASSVKYLTQGSAARDAIVSQLTAPSGTLGQSTEALTAGMGWLDASPIEALNWGLVDPTKHIAQSTMASMRSGLVPPSGEGFMRDQSGAYYDSQEWVFIDLRSDRAFSLGGETSLSTSLFTWNTDQAVDNFGELSELHDATTADYAGASPMVGFGAGAYIIALTDRGTPVVPACGAFAVEPTVITDGGANGSVADAGWPTFDGAIAVGPDGSILDSGHPATGDAGHAGSGSGSGSGRSSEPDGGKSTPTGSSSGCVVTPASRGGDWLLMPLLGAWLVYRRKRS